MDIIQSILKKFEENPLLWGMYYFPHHFRDVSPSFHLKILKEAMNNRFLAIVAPRESAKAQSLDSKVLTKNGWKRIGDLSVGDMIFNNKNQEVIVKELLPIKKMDLYKVTFQCGEEVICNLDHLWEVYCPSNTKDKKLVKPLRDILKNYKSSRYDKRFKTNYKEYRYYIKCAKAVEFDEFDEKELYLDPYTLGVWLGDGHTAGQRITVADEEIIDNIPYECVKNKHKYNWGIKGINKKLKKIGVLGNKHIPENYLFSSIKQREALLQGLIDTDGHIDKNKGCIDFSNSNLSLIKQVQHLVRSLGGKTKLMETNNLCNGKRHKSFRIAIWLPKNITPCRLNRKLKNYKPIDCFDYLKNRIKDISFYKKGLGRCISVQNNIYLTDDFIPTHNSTILGFLRPAHGIAFKKFRHIILVQNTYSKAVGSLLSIKSEFKDNTKLKNDFKITITKDSEGETIFKHLDGFETRVLCKGAEQIGTIRGEKFGAFRPDLIVIDDLESDEMVRNPEIRSNLQEAYDDAVEPAVDRKTGCINIIGTVLHDDCQIKKMVSKEYYKKYRKLFYKARWENTKTGEIESLWKEKWTVEELNEMERDNPRKFAKEYQGEPSSGLMAKFDKEDFRRWTISNNDYVLFDNRGNIIEKGSLMNCKPAISCDLAWEEKRSSDFSVIMPGFLTPSSNLLVDRYVAEKGMRPNKMEDIIFTMVERMEALTGKKPYVGFEKAKLEKVVKWFLKKAMRDRNHPLIFKDIQWGTDKIERIIAKLEPRYHQNMIFHRDNMGDLEYQLLHFPTGKHDDIIDCLQGLVQILEIAPRLKNKKENIEDEGFAYLLNLNKKKKSKERFIFGKKSQKLTELPFTETFR